MAERWTVTSDVDPGVEWIPFGPEGDELPAAFTATVDYSERPVTVTLGLTFAGERVRVATVTVQGKDGQGVTPRDMANLQLGEVVQDAVRPMVNPGHGRGVRPRPGQKPTPDELRLVASVYWFHHVAWGDPRRAVMVLWDIPRATANRWLRRCRELYDMPGGE